ncbi:MAG: TonB-dependent receptor [Gammaproteobacteria bacterium]|nr:TonB-dependent receptor [Gammaproteobacteria bacterium]MDH3362652.1 TonB-dependent receptor [Gammaproteobacteria bacterium]MDH3480438.1 TonB-dependent receptor [Gammaproteobacteria bacterium]
MRLSISIALSALLSVSSLSVAADISPHDTLIVTATRTPIPLSDATVPVTIITREDIELSLASDLSELLRFEAGIDIGRNGGPGQATSVFLRGTESNHTLVLIDGVRMNPSTIGGAAIQNIAPEVIERIEIVKGARSALFGTDAIGGVINIITRRADRAYFEGGVGGGSFASQSGQVSGGNRNEDGEFGINLNWQATDGYAPRTDSDITRGYDNLSANFYGAKRFGANELSVRHWRGAGNVEYLDFFLSPVDQDFENTVTAIEFDTRVSEFGNSKLILSFVQDEIAQNQAPDFVNSERLSLDWQYSHAFGKHTLTGGLFAVEEDASARSFGSGFREDTHIRAFFLQDQVILGRHKAFVALRLTDNENFGNHTTWNAEYALAINDAFTLNVGWGHAFRAPDASDRFGFGGSPLLKPELADERQLALRYAAGGRYSLYFEYYANDIEDLIEFDLQSFTLKNLNEANIRGMQLGYEYRGDSFVFRADIVRQQADDAATGTRLLRRAERTASLSYTQNIGLHRLGLSILASGDRVDFGGVELPGYVVANLTGQLQLSDAWQLNARIENLLNTDYQTAANYRMQEQSGFLELKYRWR